MDEDVRSKLRLLPAVDRILQELDGPHELAVAAARAALDEARRAISEGGDGWEPGQVIEEARRALDSERSSLLRPVINATGVLVHTNLGRVPLGAKQLAAVLRVATGYSNLEYDLDRGRRGSRYHHASGLLHALTGADAALVVNNNAAAVLLTVAALAGGREVIVSRGELVEIGGEFRIPDVIESSGARLVEVGTTNRTHLADYERAIGPDTAAILKVHPSNYRIVGFTRTVTAREVARLAKGRGICFVHDLGSGLMQPSLGGAAAEDEPLIGNALAEGADLVTFSGDKLFGGPQAGIIAGRADLIEKLSSHPLLRALRVDKMTLAALQSTLLAYLEGREDELPLMRMALAPVSELETRARQIADSLAGTGLELDVVETSSVAGGGSSPGTEQPSRALVVGHPELSADQLAERLRGGPRPVIGRIEEDRLLLDLRAVLPEDDQALAAVLTAVLRA
jgi:L-seryl-tRNA(Ser) seleniumtransferase